MQNALQQTVNTGAGKNPVWINRNAATCTNWLRSIFYTTLLLQSVILLS